MRYIIRDRLAVLAALVVALTGAIIWFSLTSDLPVEKPMIGVVLFATLPGLAFAGAVIFYLAVRSEGFRGDE